MLKDKFILFLKTHLAMQYRLNRRRFIIGLAAALCLSLLYTMLSIGFEAILHPTKGSFSEKLFSFNYLDPFLVLMPFILSIGRLYDLDKGKKWLVLYVIPGINLVFLLYLMIFPGSDKENNYGRPVTDLSDHELAATVSSLDGKKTGFWSSMFFSWQGQLKRNGFFWQFSLINTCVYSVFIIILFMIVISGISLPALSLEQLALLDDAAINNIVEQIHWNDDKMTLTVLLFAGLMFYLNGLLLSSCICLSMRRWHDMGKSSLYVLYSRIPSYLLGWLFSINDNNLWLYYNVLLFLFLVVMPGKSTTNNAVISSVD